MNRYGLICALMFILALKPVAGQDFNGGLKLGFDISQIDGDQLGGYHKGGLIFGAFINREISSTLKWQMEMFYIGKGSKKGINPNKNQFDFRRISVNYIEVPLLLQFWLKRLKTNFELGLSFSTLISSKEEDGFGERNSLVHSNVSDWDRLSD